MNKRDMQEILQAMDRHTKAMTDRIEKVLEPRPPAPPGRELLPIPPETLHSADVQRMLNEYKAAIEWADKVLQDYRREVADVQERLKQLSNRMASLERKARAEKPAVLEPEVQQSLRRKVRK